MSMFKDNKYNSAAFMLYMAMFLHGIQAIILSQNAEYFAETWGTNIAGVLSVIGWTGIGKIAFQLFSGPLSDKIGRKPVAIAGVIGYIVSFGMLLFANNLTLAIISTVISGAATSLFDGSVNPGVMEIYPNDKSTASVFNKGFISVSGTLYPLIVGWVASTGAFPTLSIWIPFILSIAVLLGLIFSRFPEEDYREKYDLTTSDAIQRLAEDNRTSGKTIQKVSHPKFVIDGLLIVLFSFFIYSTFFLFQQVSAIYATDVVGMSEIAARSVTSSYQIGSFLAVILSSILMARGIRDITLLVVYPLIAGMTALVIYFFPTELTLTVGAFIIGYTAAGGALQLGNSMLSQFFDENMGRNTSIYFLSMSVGTLAMPNLASWLKSTDFTKVMLVDAIVALIAFVLMFILSNRYKKIFGVSAFSRSNK